MTPYLDDGDVRLYVGDARDVLAQLPERSVHAVMCSPPFFALRDYGTGQWEGGNDPTCDHIVRSEKMRDSRPGGGLTGGTATIVASGARGGEHLRSTCRRCGAVRVDRQIGLEATPDEYVAELVGVFAEARRVLRDDGSLWIEIGDSFSAGRRGAFSGDGVRPQTKEVRTQVPQTKGGTPTSYPTRPVTEVPGKNLFLIPWRLALALQDAGWIVRGTYVWEKPDAMPESTRDRCTVSHSTVLHLAKGPRYFFDRHAILEPFADYGRGMAVELATLDGMDPEAPRGPDGRRVLHVAAGANSEQHRDGDRWPSLDGRSPRSVWRIATEASSFGLCRVCRRYWPERAPAKHCGEDVVAHFALWPHELVGKIIACSTSEAGCCADCGAPRIRVTKSEQDRDHATTAEQRQGRRDHGAEYGIRDGVRVLTDHLGWQPSCECAAPSVPCVVLDPFAGSATTGRQARRMGRHAVLVELSPDYAEIAAHRLGQQALDLVG